MSFNDFDNLIASIPVARASSFWFLPVAFKRSRITEKEFYDQIADIDQNLPEKLKIFFSICEDIGLAVTTSRALMTLHWFGGDGGRTNFGTIFPNGHFQTNDIVGDAYERGDEKIGTDYLEALASAHPKRDREERG